MEAELETSNVERRTSNVQVMKPIFQIGETVFSAIQSNARGMITGVLIRPNTILYYVTWAQDGLKEGMHDAIELSREPLYHQATR